MSLLKWLNNISPFRGMPVDEKKSSSAVGSQSAETIQFYYNSSGTLTIDAGQAAGVVVMAKLTYNNILNLFGDSLAKKGDTSLTFTSTALTTEVGIDVVQPTFVEALDECDWVTRMAKIGALLTTNGQYYVDYAKGLIYAKKASTQSSATAGAYKYNVNGGLNGPIPSSSSAASYSAFQNLGANATLNVKATAGNVFSLVCHNLNGSTRYLQLHNTATTPGGGATPLYTFPVPANSAIVIGNDFFGLGGANFSTGIAFAFSTTEATYTAGTATDQMTHIMYK